MRESEKYFIVPNWMLYIGGGFTPRTGILAVICSFCRDENGEYTKQCKASTAFLSDKVGCSRRQAFRELHYLLEAGYITAHKGARQTDIVSYSVNIENCEKAMQAYDTQSQAYDTQSQAYDTQSQAYDTQSQAYDTQSQDLMTECHKLMTGCHPINTSIKTNIKTSDIIGSESARARDSETCVSVPGFPEIRLTETEYSFLKKRIDYKPAKKSLEAYFAIIESQKAKGIEYPDHFKKVREMAMQDGARILKRESSSFDLDELMQYANRFPDDSSSIDMQEVDSIMNPLGGSSSAADTA